MRHYVRAIAYAQQRNRAGFDRELASIRALRDSQDLQPMIDQGVPARDLLQIAESVGRARWAHAHRRFNEAARLYREAIAVEEKVPYMEPPYWYYPVRQSLGASLYRAGRYQDAAAAFTEALTQAPNNGWTLYGLAASERALGRTAREQAAEAALKRAWAGNPRWLNMDRL
jgi:tetratricopeptide (TPR) repeat protein